MVANNTMTELAKLYSKIEPSRTKTENEFLSKTRAAIETMAYYFGDDWIDMDYIKNTLRLKMSRRRLSERGTSNQPMRCPVCGKIFAVCINYAKVKEEYRLDEDVFGGIPIEECVCGECCG